MAKKQPPGTVSRVLFLPEDLHKKITALSAHGKADDLIIECVREALEPRYRQWLEQEVRNAGQLSATSDAAKPTQETPLRNAFKTVKQ